MKNQNNAACLLGALVADAATMGQHWIYDVERIAEVSAANDGQAAFAPIKAQNYEGVKSYYAHGTRADGDLSQYGLSLRIAIQSMLKSDGALDVATYQSDYVDVFGFGGSYNGYIDRPTRGTLENIAAGKTDPSGIDDDQLPAITRLPAVVVMAASSNDFESRIEEAIRITNVNEGASQYGLIFANLLVKIREGTDLNEAMAQCAEEATGEASNLLKAALKSDETSSIAYGEVTSRACHLPMGMPLMFHILKRSASYAEAVETNILAGGDNCGRSIMIGAIMGAKYGIDDQNGIPLNWILKTRHASAIWQECQALTAMV